MITFEQGKRLVDNLQKMGVDWDDICDLWGDEVFYTAKENRWCAPEVIRQIESYARKHRAIVMLEKGREHLRNARWIDDHRSIGLSTTEGLPVGAELSVIGRPGGELIQLTAVDKCEERWSVCWDGEELDEVEKYLPKDWRSEYAYAYQSWCGMT